MRYVRVRQYRSILVAASSSNLRISGRLANSLGLAETHGFSDISPRDGGPDVVDETFVPHGGADYFGSREC